MTRLLTTACVAGLLALPAFAQTQTPQAKPDNPAAATGMMSTGQDSGAATKTKKPATAADESKAPAKKRAAKAAAAQDPEHAQIVELNRRELQRIESGQR